MLPVFARPEACPPLLLRFIQCRWCDFVFCVCRRCWRGQAYCCDQCRRAAKLRSHRKAQRKYRQTEKGKKAHRLAENRRRYRKINPPLKNMDDATTRTPSDWAMVTSRKENLVVFSPDLQGRCHFCGRIGQIVSTFPRRSYA